MKITTIAALRLAPAQIRSRANMLNARKQMVASVMPETILTHVLGFVSFNHLTEVVGSY